MAADKKKGGGGDDDGGEFADFMADISEEIALRVESLDPARKPKAEARKATPVAPAAGLILEWDNVADRMIEEIR